MIDSDRCRCGLQPRAPSGFITVDSSYGETVAVLCNDCARRLVGWLVGYDTLEAIDPVTADLIDDTTLELYQPDRIEDVAV